MSQWAHYSTPDPDFVAAYKALGLGPIPISLEAIPVLRERTDVFVKAQNEASDYPKTGLVVTERRIPVEGSEEGILARFYTPESADESETFPIVVDFHGGGYTFGNLDSDDVKCREACVHERAVVVNVDYRLAPEHPYPTGLNDAWSSVKWVYENAASLRGDPKKGFVLVGLSAGAYFVIVITHRARNDPILKGVITGQILQIPPTAGSGGFFPEKFADQILSYEQNKDDPVLTPSRIQVFRESFNPPPPDTPEVSPILAESFAGLPPAVFQIAGADPLRDEGLLYHKFLSESGIKTKLTVYPGVPHGFSIYIPTLKISQKFRNDFAEGFKWLLGRSD